MKKDLSLVTCYKCNQKGHYANKCAEKGTSWLQWTGITEGCRKYKEMPQHNKVWPTWKKLYATTAS
jgi:hypothetical protein